MIRKLITSGSPFEETMAYSRAVVDGDWIWVSGTTGFNYDTMTISDDVAEQADQTFRNIKSAMERRDSRWRTSCAVPTSSPSRGISSPAGRCSRNTWATSARPHGDGGGPRRSAHEDRNRSDGEEAA